MYITYVCVCVCVCVQAGEWVRVGGSGMSAWERACACARVTLLIEHKTPRNLRPLWLNHIFDITSETARYSEKFTEYKMCDLILFATCV
jgi:hypothetical protein